MLPSPQEVIFHIQMCAYICNQMLQEGYNSPLKASSVSPPALSTGAINSLVINVS